MKNKFCIIAIALAIGLISCSSEFTESDLKVEEEVNIQENIVYQSGFTYPGIAGKEDPNLDPSWTWTDKELVRVYYTSSSDVDVEREIALPWHTQGNPLNVADKDISPQDGWAFAFKDFGTPERRPGMPYLSLYNENTQTLRLFFYNSQRIGASYFKGELVLKDIVNGHEELYRGEAKAVANSHDSWVNLEYKVNDFPAPLDIDKYLIEFFLSCILETIVHTPGK